jgi:hypothetical protein
VIRREYTSAYVPDLRFTEADLAANRRGVLTASQEAVVAGLEAERRRGARMTLRWTLAVVAVLLVAGAVVELARGTSVGGLVVGLLIAGAGLGVVLLVAALSPRVLSRDLWARRIGVAEGEADPLVEEAWAKHVGRYQRYELRLRDGSGRSLFRLGNQRSIDQFTPGRRYRVYYLEDRPFPVLLSFEEAPPR